MLYDAASLQLTAGETLIDTQERTAFWTLMPYNP